MDIAGVVITCAVCTAVFSGGLPGLGRGLGGRGLHSSTFRLNVSALCGIGGAFRGCLGVVYGVSGGIGGRLGCISCQKRLRLS
jgi:hypothetical protein